MNRRDLLLTGGAATMSLVLAGPARAARIVSAGVTESGSLRRNRGDFPVPREPNQVMYLQRSINSNTVIWAARFNGSGGFDSPPAYVYWRKFNDNGERKGLNLIERTAGFGLNISGTGDPSQFSISARALPSFGFLLQQTGPGQAVAWCRLGGRSVIADHAFVQMQGELKATDLFVHGRDPRTGTYLTEHFRVEGGILG